MRNVHNIGRKTQRGKKHSEDAGICGWIILDWILEKLVQKGVGWIRLAQDGGYLLVGSCEQSNDLQVP
jgi:hypothetical protein